MKKEKIRRTATEAVAILLWEKCPEYGHIIYNKVFNEDSECPKCLRVIKVNEKRYAHIFKKLNKDKDFQRYLKSTEAIQGGD